MTWACWKTCVRDARRWLSCAALFGQDLADEPIRELMGLFAQSLNGLGQFLLQLRVDDVLEYSPELAQRLDRGEPIAAGSIEDIELRACAIHAVELLVAELRHKGVPVTAMRIDHVLWYRGQGERYRQGPRRHRTRTIFY